MSPLCLKTHTVRFCYSVSQNADHYITVHPWVVLFSSYISSPFTIRAQHEACFVVHNITSDSIVNNPITFNPITYNHDIPKRHTPATSHGTPNPDVIPGVTSYNPSLDLTSMADRLLNRGPKAVIAVAPAFSEDNKGGGDVSGEGIEAARLAAESFAAWLRDELGGPRRWGVIASSGASN